MDAPVTANGRAASLQTIGHSVPRKEDRALVRGEGSYSDDQNLAGQAYGVVVRSQHAHGLIRRIDVSAALAAPGVLAVFTGEIS